MKRAILFSIIFFLLISSASAKLIRDCYENIPNYWISESDIIVFGEVVDTKSYVPEDREDPYFKFGTKTHTKIAVQRYIKGSGPDELTIFSLGDKKHWFEDEPTFEIGEKGYLFLRKQDEKFYSTVCGAGVVNEKFFDWNKIKKAISQLEKQSPVSRAREQH